MKKKLSKYLFILIFFLLIIEFFSFLFTKLNLLSVNYEPDYIHSYGNKWRTENTIWGSWHKKITKIFTHQSVSTLHTNLTTLVLEII